MQAYILMVKRLIQSGMAPDKALWHVAFAYSLSSVETRALRKSFT